MISVEDIEGRLIEIRSIAPITMADTQSMVTRLVGILAASQARFVGCGDLRRATVVTPEITDASIALLRRENPRIDRTGFLIDSVGAVLGMQLERIVREANNPARKVFRDPVALRAFLEPVLTVAERRRLEVFLALA
jgi:hypothetical protein